MVKISQFWILTKTYKKDDSGVQTRSIEQTGIFDHQKTKGEYEEQKTGIKQEEVHKQNNKGIK